MRQNLKAYKKVNIESTLLTSNPHQVILMMYDGALQNMFNAKGAIERSDLSLKSETITKAINIFNALRNSLDFESQPAISKNFDDLYSYCVNKLVDISVTLKSDEIDEVVALIKPVRDAWAEMPEAGKQEGLQLLKEKNAELVTGE